MNCKGSRGRDYFCERELFAREVELPPWGRLAAIIEGAGATREWLSAGKAGKRKYNT